MFSQLNVIKYAIKQINLQNQQWECCNSCGEDCDELMKFICFGRSIEDINTYIANLSDEERTDIFENKL